MELRKIKRNGSIFFSIISILQIILILNTIPAEGYILNTGFEFGQNTIENKDIINKIFDKGLDFLIGFLIIKQIGTVSAALEDGLICCSQLKASEGGAICQNIADIESETIRCEPGELYQTSCENTQECRIGTCIIDDGLSCLDNSPKAACEEGGGEWDSREEGQISQCRKGCCVVGSNAIFQTLVQCEQSTGEFFPEINNEFTCSLLAENILEGACVVNENCVLSTSLDCAQRGGNYYSGHLCSNPELEELGVNCEAQDSVGLISGKDEIFWFDSCGNRENIYSSDKTASWNNGRILNKADSCNSDSANINSQTCGNCNRFLGSEGFESRVGEASIQDGNYICRDLSCNVNVDLNDDGDTNDAGESYKKNNGESWCIYEGSIGNQKGKKGFASDTVGSEHWIADCLDGEVTVNRCGSQRDKICQQQILDVQNSDETFTVAQCVVNDAETCFTYNPLQDSSGKVKSGNVADCNENSHCMIKKVAVAESFKFDVCVPKYPKGTDLKNPSFSDIYCSQATAECTVIYQKGIRDWHCKKNCLCETKEFSEQMNDLCISMGDCGSYIDFKGYGTNDGVKISLRERSLKEKVLPPGKYSYSNYLEFSDADPNDYVPIPEADLGGTNVQPTGGDFNLEVFYELNEAGLIGDETTEKILKLGGVLGGTYGEDPGKYLGLAGILTWGFTYVFSVDAVLTTTEIIVFGDPIGGGAALYETIPGTTLSSFALVIAGVALGSIIGGKIAEHFGITGPAATVIIFSGGTAGGAFVYNYLIIESSFALGLGIGSVILIAIVILSKYGKSEEGFVKFECRPWQAPTGGDNCGECSDDPLLRCTQYKCESLGQACVLLNSNSDEAVCESIEFEQIPPDLDPLKINTEGYEFDRNDFSNNEIWIRPENDTNGCIQEYIPVEFVLKSDEFAQCKWDLEVRSNYEDMEFEPLEGNYYLENHTFGVGGLGLSALDSLEISGNVRDGFTGDLRIYIRCQDFHGNWNPNEYVVNYCLESGPDRTRVSHLLTEGDPKNGATLPYGTNETDVTLWINEPAECKYDSNPNVPFDNMANNMTCGIHPITDAFLGKWPCRTTLTNLETENTIYVRCKDQPWGNVPDDERNINTDDYEYVLHVTRDPLQIISISPSGEIKGGGFYFTFDLEAVTAGGSDNGKASCEYEFESHPNIKGGELFETGGTKHKQPNLKLQNGDYEVSIMCTDSARNVVTKNSDFTLNFDQDDPVIVRVFKDKNSGRLKIITDEEAKCSYKFNSTSNCNFEVDEGVSISTGFTTEHSTTWDAGNTYYIKCEDIWENPNAACGIVVSPELILE